MGPEMIKESFLNVSCFFVFGYLQVFLREVIASASLDAFAESSVSMKQAMVVSGMSHVMVKLFAPWVSWKVLPYSGKIVLLFVLHTVAFLIIVVANSPASRLVGVVSFQVGNAMAENTFLSLGTFYGDVGAAWVLYKVLFITQVYPHGHMFRLELWCRSSSPPRSSSSLCMQPWTSLTSISDRETTLLVSQKLITMLMAINRKQANSA